MPRRTQKHPKKTTTKKAKRQGYDKDPVILASAAAAKRYIAKHFDGHDDGELALITAICRHKKEEHEQ